MKRILITSIDRHVRIKKNAGPPTNVRPLYSKVRTLHAKFVNFAPNFVIGKVRELCRTLHELCHEKNRKFRFCSTMFPVCPRILYSIISLRKKYFLIPKVFWNIFFRDPKIFLFFFTRMCKVRAKFGQSSNFADDKVRCKVRTLRLYKGLQAICTNQVSLAKIKRIQKNQVSLTKIKRIQKNQVS